MAPTPPTTQAKRPSARAKALARLKDPPLPRKLHRADNAVPADAGFADTKRDRRQIRRSAFVSRVAESSSAAGAGGGSRVGKKRSRQRRPARKLVATLESLGDALGEIETEVRADAEAAMDVEQARAGKVRHRSLKSRPGALKRKEKIVKGEMERFSRSLAQLSALPADSRGEKEGEGGEAAAGAGTVKGEAAMETEGTDETQATQKAPAVPNNSTSNRWAALRGFISATMEQNPAFTTKS